MIVIDEEKIKAVGITINETIHLYKLKDNTIQYDEFVNYKKLENLKLIKIIVEDGKEHYIIRTAGLLLLDSMMDEHKKSKSKSVKLSQRNINQMIDNGIDEYRLKWKAKGLGLMGSLKSCKVKLKRWFEENPKYTMEDVNKAADIYINSLNDYRFLQNAEYFIFKGTGKSETSRLSAFIEEINTKQVKSGWSSALN